MTKIRLAPSYKSALKTKQRYRIIYGGAGSGKSHFLAQETLINMLQDNRYSYLVVRKTGKSIRISVFRLLVEMIAEYNLTHLFRINRTEMSMTCVNGSSLITSGLDDVEKLKSVANINRIWVEEASEITESDFSQLDLRMRGTSALGYQMTLTFNPISELHWLKKRFFDIGDKQAFVLKTTYKDNPFLDDKYIQTLQTMKTTDPQYFKIYALGEWGSVGNLVYTNWKKEDLSDIKNTFDNHFNGLDFGFAEDPTAFIRVHLDNKHKRIYIVDEMYLVQEHIDALARKLAMKINNEMITCDSSEPRSIADLKRHGIRALAAKKGPGSIEHGIKWIQGYQLVVDEHCINTIKELTSYSWREDKDGNAIPKPVDANNHLLDALRYALENEMIQNKTQVKFFKGGI
ncbi:PBSX family phage terminase large subunit [Allofustis seminis]|uniref:PBSX family phage terminase large subunit n=1 Tax=Allofustis seminis TaxID=166939 RepID=UPI0003821186|nr:PBSX family phage terminase large subunit [Allofustis seminis]